eukprot:9658-Eustigmatos_ZCMA.PRE.1
MSADRTATRARRVSGATSRARPLRCARRSAVSRTMPSRASTAPTSRRAWGGGCATTVTPASNA